MSARAKAIALVALVAIAVPLQLCGGLVEAMTIILGTAVGAAVVNS